MSREQVLKNGSGRPSKATMIKTTATSTSIRTTSKYNKPKPPIPATDPAKIRDLWLTVRKQSSRNMSGTKKPAKPPQKNFTSPTTASENKKAAGKQKGLDVHTPPSTATSSKSYAARSINTITTSGTLSITLKSPRFRELCLVPRRIEIDDILCSVGSPQVHFGAGGTTEYSQLEGLAEASIWLHADDQFFLNVQREYHFMSHYSLCESEFASFAKENLLKREPRRLMSDNRTIPGSRVRSVERMVEFACKPGFIPLWKAPPFVASSSDTLAYPAYDFNIRPDCTYWLSLHAFSSEYVGQIQDVTAVAQKRLTCPYLTIEFKKDESAWEQAVDQVAAFGALALYNRYLLRAKCVLDTNQEWAHEQTCQLRHYGLTATGSTYTFWCMRPTLEMGKWSGCHMAKIFRDDLQNKKGVENFVQWINAIHAWGLTSYVESCERDVKTLLSNQRFRVSDIKPIRECSCGPVDEADVTPIEATTPIEG